MIDGSFEHFLWDSHEDEQRDSAQRPMSYVLENAQANKPILKVSDPPENINKYPNGSDL